VWLENEAPTTSTRSDSFISQLATGVEEHPAAQHDEADHAAQQGPFRAL
jgi:hypothetical protein